ncbi:MAG: formate--tetrahydrofolate ligase [Planctomycetaceae bacterium]|nr:formate--tetrahydrofolate ligase [Planctomycetaceae bacterium]
MKSDIEIAQQASIRPIGEIAHKAGIGEEYLEHYGNTKAKVDNRLLQRKRNPDGKLVLVSAINPTAAGEGKTTTTVGLADALCAIGKKAVVAMREPSLGPVFGIKGGAAGGGMAQVIPMEDINLHFTGDFHAVGTANNLLAAMLDNHIHQGNTLRIHPKRITWKRCMDMNDRQLRGIVGGLGKEVDGVLREDGFDITAASEIMAILCLAADIRDLKQRLARIVVGYTQDHQPVRAADLNAHGAMTALLKDAIKPNLVQTLEGTPALIHGGPFANIAHGCNSLMATRMALRLGEYAVTEAGFGADLGAQKFFDIKCRVAGLRPDAVVLVATVRALKLHGGADKQALEAEDLVALEKGLPNLLRHVDNLKNVYHVPTVVAINRFPGDTRAELERIATKCRDPGINAVVSEVWQNGSEGGLQLAQEVVRLCDEPNGFRFCHADDLPILEKIRAVTTKIYRASDIDISPEAVKQAQRLESLGFGSLPVCMAKTQYSFSDDPSRLGAPDGFTIHVRSLRLLAGAGFIVAMTGDILTMPGLPKDPAAEKIDVDDDGKISGLF